MDQRLYVATDAKGVEHSATGRVAWKLPVDGVGQVTDLGHPLVLREAKALLEVLDERIYLAESPKSVEIGPDGTVSVPTAQLSAPTHWDAEAATRFALDCADHLLSEVGDFALPDGTSLTKVTADARQMLDGAASKSMEHLGQLARLHALRRLRHERTEIAGASLEQLEEDEQKDIDAFDDPAYATAITVTDSVLAAIEALRHYVLPEFYGDFQDDRENREQHAIEDRQTSISAPTLISTPLGPVALHAPHLLPYDPAWTSARESARHARLAIKDRKGADGEASELAWQATALTSLL
ncbi:MAG: hypothetical protein WA860_08705 [Acidimicrobiales bacterium]